MPFIPMNTPARGAVGPLCVEFFDSLKFLVEQESSLSTHTNENKQPDLLTPNGVRKEEVSRVNGEQIRVPEGNRDCRLLNSED